MSLSLISNNLPKEISTILKGKEENSWIKTLKKFDKAQKKKKEDKDNKGKSISKLFEAIVKNADWSSNTQLKKIAKEAHDYLTAKTSKLSDKVKKRYETTTKAYNKAFQKKTETEKTPAKIVPKVALKDTAVEKSAFMRLPAVMHDLIIGFLVRSEDYLSPKNDRKIFQVCKYFDAAENKLLNGKNDLIIQIIKKKFKNSSKIPKLSVFKPIGTKIDSFHFFSVKNPGLFLTQIAKCFPNITKLDLTEACDIKKQLGFLQKLPKLKELILDREPDTDGSPKDYSLEAVARASTLERLSLKHCEEITPVGIAHLCKGLPQLTSLDLEGSLCPVNPPPNTNNNDITIHLLLLKKLQHLNLRGIDNLSDSGYKRIAKIPTLRTLSIEGGRYGLTAEQQLSVSTLRSFSDLSQLKAFFCEGCTNEQLQAIAASLPHLQALRLPDSTITNGGVQHLLKFTELCTLNLDAKEVTDELQKLSALTNLKNLKIHKLQPEHKNIIDTLQVALPNLKVKEEESSCNF